MNSACETTRLPSGRAGKRTTPVCEPDRLPARCVPLWSQGRGVLDTSRLLVRRLPPRQQEFEGWVAHAQGASSPSSGRNGCFQDEGNRLRTWLAFSAIDESFVIYVPIAVPAAFCDGIMRHYTIKREGCTVTFRCNGCAHSVKTSSFDLTHGTLRAQAARAINLHFAGEHPPRFVGMPDCQRWSTSMPARY